MSAHFNNANCQSALLIAPEGIEIGWYRINI